MFCDKDLSQFVFSMMHLMQFWKKLFFIYSENGIRTVTSDIICYYFLLSL